MSTYKHILVPTDFSEHSKRAVKKALELGKLFDARLSVVHVVDYLPPTYISAQAEYTSAPKIIERATAYLATWAIEVGLEGAEQLVATGTAGREIVATAKARGADLIAIGTSGEGGIKRLLGSTTRAVMYDAPCDVLSVHCD
ncbi:MAG: universal stress protein [Lysobacterales bacterium]|nr:MAG: universal stress protein [Xanthomonadales bacterium]